MKYLTWLLILLFYSCIPDSNNPQSEDTPVQSEEEIYFEDYVSSPNKWGYIDSKGDEVIPPQFDAVRNFNEGIAIVNREGKWGFIDTMGRWVIEPVYKGAWEFNDGLARVKVFEKGYGFIDRTHQMVIQPNLEDVFDFSSNRARAKDANYVGFIDREGNWIIPAQFESASDFKHNLAVVKKDGKYGLIDTAGKLVIPNEYERIQTDASASGYLAIKDKKYYHIGPSFNILNKFGYEGATLYFNNRAFIKKEARWNLIDQKGKSYNRIAAKRVIPAGDNRWICQIDGGFTLCNQEGMIMTDEVYDQLNKFKEGRSAFLKGRMWGYLDEGGNEIIPARFLLIWDFKNGYARVADESGIYFIDRSGKRFLNAPYTDIRDFYNNRARFQEQ